MLQPYLQEIGQFTGLILSPAIFSTSVFAQIPNAIPSVDALSQPATTAKSLETLPKNDRVGIQFQGTLVLNEGKLLSLTGTRTNTKAVSVGKCLGSLYVPPNTVTTTTPYTTQVGARASFISHTTPPAPGLRVIIQNITPEIDQSVNPYTDREYFQGDRSEAFMIKQDITQSSRYLTVTPGINRFTYQIQQGKQIVESGSFTTSVTVETKADKQPESSESLNEASNECEQKEPSHEVEVPDIEPSKIPSLSPEVQQLIDESKK
jgi:hypothetical protein